MAKLSANTVTLNDGDIRLYQRDHSRAWQARFKVDGRWVRITTKHKRLAEAKERAKELYIEYRMRQKAGLPVVSKRFADVAAYCIADMEKQTAVGAGKVSYRDYRIVLDRYLIPYFGDKFVSSITYEELQRFAKWRADKLGREPSASTLNTHNSALNRVFNEAVARGYMNKSQVPVLVNKGRDSTRRPDFRREEYKQLIRKMPGWINMGRDGKSRDMRHLLRDYILVLANTGIRHGTEAANLRWKHIHLFEESGLTFLEMHVSGKTGPRDIICRARTVDYLKRIHARCNDIAHLSFEQLLNAQLDLPVFRLPDGTVSNNMHQTFRILMKDTGLAECPRTGQVRTLYSFRHTYATFALLNDGMSIHTLAVQMGTSIQMIERHYSHLTPRLQKELLTGKRYDLSKEEYMAQQRMQAHALSASALIQPVDDDTFDLPNEPESDSDDASDTRVSITLAQTPSQTHTDAPTAVEIAFDMFDRSELSETALLALIGVDKAGYKASEATLTRALASVKDHRLSEEALASIVGK
jgi:integrase